MSATVLFWFLPGQYFNLKTGADVHTKLQEHESEKVLKHIDLKLKIKLSLETLTSLV